MNKQKNLVNKNRDSFKTSKDVIASLKYAFSGLIYCYKTTRNFRIQIFLGLLVLIFCFIFNSSLYEFLIIISTIFSVLILELLNTAIESIVDLNVKKKFNKLAKISKDCSAASVLLASLNSICVAAFVFFPKIRLLLFS
tara:strand:+ start:457 stop:873 length:417 start_codon:yes stop_codon:yes gene_type:complete